MCSERTRVGGTKAGRWRSCSDWPRYRGYGFVAGLEIPLWPAFIASSTFYAAGSGLDGLQRAYASNFTGIIYAAATLLIVETLLDGGVLALSIVSMLIGAVIGLATDELSSMTA